MIIRDLHFVGIAIPPFEADSPLVVDADAVLADLNDLISKPLYNALR